MKNGTYLLVRSEGLIPERLALQAFLLDKLERDTEAGGIVQMAINSRGEEFGKEVLLSYEDLKKMPELKGNKFMSSKVQETIDRKTGLDFDRDFARALSQNGTQEYIRLWNKFINRGGFHDYEHLYELINLVRKEEQEKFSALVKLAKTIANLPDCACCERANKYNGYGSDAPRDFVCPKSCSCHD